MVIDTTFDFRTDAGGKDPDSRSPTLRRYHRLLWSKMLPTGEPFELVQTTPRAYLHHRSDLGEFWLASDSVIPSFKSWVVAGPVLEQLDEGELESFRTIGYTIGGMMVFPGNRIDNKWTINMARGMSHKIADRMDLTLECIRRHYAGHPSPMQTVLSRYNAFFHLFEDLSGYVDFFLLQDLVNDAGPVRFFLPFDDFRTPAIPRDLSTYREYRQRSEEFVVARNRRIDNWARQNLPL